MTVMLHPMAERTMVALSAVLLCTGCNPREYVRWDPDISVAARRADLLPDGKSATVRLVDGRTVEARDISFEGEVLRWTVPGSGFVSTLPLSQVDTVRVRGERHTKRVAIGGAMLSFPWLAVAAAACLDGPRCSTNGGTNWKYPLVIGVVTGAAGTALGAGIGWLSYKWLIFVP